MQNPGLLETETETEKGSSLSLWNLEEPHGFSIDHFYKTIRIWPEVLWKLWKSLKLLPTLTMQVLKQLEFIKAARK